MRLIHSETFHSSLSRLASQEQTLVKAAVMDFFNDLTTIGKPRPGLRYHKLDRTVRDPGIRSFSVSMDLRVIVHQSGEDYVLLYANHHDPAYDWAARRQLRPNPQSGAMQLIDVEEVTKVVTHTVTETQKLLFAHYEPDYLMSLGVPEIYVSAVRSATEENFDTLFEVLPDEASDRLLELRDGKLALPPARPTSGDPYDHVDTRKHFLLTTTEEELQRAMSGRWEEWMVYLHPTQRLLAERQQTGAVKVFGSAGTGKTVVALHRAASLVRQRPHARILLTSYSRALATRLEEKLRLLLPQEALLRQIKVINLHRLALDLARKWRLPSRVLTESELEERLRQAAQQAASDVSFSLLLTEWRGVIEPQGIRSWSEYRTAPRTGRGVPLGAKQRKVMWDVYESLIQNLQEAGETTWSLLCDDVTRELQQRGPQFDHAIVDESQDLGRSELLLLRALVEPQGNDLFLCGDPGQRIFRGRSSWLSCGIDVRGRSQRLKINYRTSREIQQHADRLLGKVTDEEEQPESRRTVSKLRGPIPELRECSTQEEQLQIISDWLGRCLLEGMQIGELAVFTRSRPDALASALGERLGVETQKLGDQSHDPDRLTVTTMHASKGMEFRAVVIADLGVQQFPSPQALQAAHDPADYEARLEEEKRLLYVASTRAREKLLTTWVGEASPLLSVSTNSEN